MTEELVLSLRHVTAGYREGGVLGRKRFHEVLHDVSFDVHRGEICGLVGESGTGKSTLARTILQMVKPEQGEVIHYTKRPQMIFQDPYASLNPKIKIGNAIAEPMLLHGQASSYAEAKEKIQHLLEVVGLQPAVFDRYPHEFSGGQRQRIGIVRALAVNPKLIFCDESVSALDVSVQAQILNLFQSLKEQFHLTYVFIGHDLAVVRYISDRVMVMYLGKVMEIAPYSELTGDNIHPYTRALLSAVPEPSITLHKERILLEGDIPSAVDPPAGCRFCQRCFMAKPICFEQEPDMKTVGPDHCVRCHFAKEG